ncbi:hypothetical protein CR513_00487, partial [Mucuna pruriens]
MKQAESDSRDQKKAKFDSNIQEEAKTDSTNLGEDETESNHQLEAGSDSKSDFGQPNLHSNRVGQSIPSTANQFSPPQSPPTKLKPLPKHLKYAYLDDHQQFPIIIANNLNQGQEEKLLNVLRKHKKAIGWTLADLLGINPSIYMHKILLEDEARPIGQQ